MILEDSMSFISASNPMDLTPSTSRNLFHNIFSFLYYRTGIQSLGTRLKKFLVCNFSRNVPHSSDGQQTMSRWRYLAQSRSYFRHMVETISSLQCSFLTLSSPSLTLYQCLLLKITHDILPFLLLFKLYWKPLRRNFKVCLLFFMAEDYFKQFTIFL